MCAAASRAKKWNDSDDYIDNHGNDKDNDNGVGNDNGRCDGGENDNDVCGCFIFMKTSKHYLIIYAHLVFTIWS